MHLTTELQKARSKILKELKDEISKFTITVGEVNTPVSVMERTRRQKVSMGIFTTESLVCARFHAKHLYFLVSSADYE